MGQCPAIEVQRQCIDGLEPGAQVRAGRLAAIAGGFRNLDAVALGQGPDRLGKTHPLVLHQEGEDVAPLAAAETVKDLLFRAHGE